MVSVKLSEAKGMSHNLHFLRFLAAILVIMSHSFALSTGNFEAEWFYYYSNGQITMGAFAVGVFFLYSGFLISRGFEKDPTVKDFFAGRCVRIFPALILMILISMFVLGPIVTCLEVREYFCDVKLYKYFLNSFFVLQHELPGVFQNNIYTATVNGALWTLPVEFFCYMISLFAYKAGVLNKKIFSLTIPLVLMGSLGVCYMAKMLEMEMLTTVLFPVCCFYMGILFGVYKDYVVLNKKLFFASIIIFILLGYLGYLKFGFIIAFCYSLIYIAFGAKDLFPKIWKSGNWSYAMYLCGFPIQQAIVDCNNGSMNPYMNIFISFPIILVFSIVLFKFGEEKATNLYKKRRSNKSEKVYTGCN